MSIPRYRMGDTQPSEAPPTEEPPGIRYEDRKPEPDRLYLPTGPTTMGADSNPYWFNPYPGERNRALPGQLSPEQPQPVYHERRNVPVQGPRIYEGPPANDGSDDVTQAVAGYIGHEQMSPEEKKQQWVRDNVWNRGLTVDEGTGEIIDPDSGQVVGQLPNFD